METVLYIEVVLNIQWNLSIENTLGPWKLIEVVLISEDIIVEPLYKGHIGTLETVLYIEVVLNSEVIYNETSHIGILEIKS